MGKEEATKEEKNERDYFASLTEEERLQFRRARQREQWTLRNMRKKQLREEKKKKHEETLAKRRELYRQRREKLKSLEESGQVSSYVMFITSNSFF